jgi:hypothetical protein
MPVSATDSLPEAGSGGDSIRELGFATEFDSTGSEAEEPDVDPLFQPSRYVSG